MRQYFSFLVAILISSFASANNMLVQNVTTSGNDPVNKTIQIQFDMSWDNSWRDAINWDAAWVFIKFKNANGLWQHAQLNLAGFANGNGTANTVKVTSDKVGAWVYRSALGSGTFNITSMQLQWNYGLNGLNDATGLEVRVFATEMVYVPEGEFNCAKGFYVSFPNSNYFTQPRFFTIKIDAPGNNSAVINNRMSPYLYYYDSSINNNNVGVKNAFTFKVRGDIGIDTNNDNIVENNIYPTGYKSFYSYKYLLTEQQYADFLNTLTASQIINLGVAGTGIYSVNQTYYSSTPDRVCGKSNSNRLFAYADWSGLRPMTFLEFNKISYGPFKPINYDNPSCSCFLPFDFFAISDMNYLNSYYPITGEVNGQTVLGRAGYRSSPNSTRQASGASYYGIFDLSFNGLQPIVGLSFLNFPNFNGDGLLDGNGQANLNVWTTDMILYIESRKGQFDRNNFGFRYVRSVE